MHPRSTFYWETKIGCARFISTNSIQQLLAETPVFCSSDVKSLQKKKKIQQEIWNFVRKKSELCILQWKQSPSWSQGLSFEVKMAAICCLMMVLSAPTKAYRLLSLPCEDTKGEADLSLFPPLWFTVGVSKGHVIVNVSHQTTRKGIYNTRWRHDYCYSLHTLNKCA